MNKSIEKVIMTKIKGKKKVCERFSLIDVTLSLCSSICLGDATVIYIYIYIYIMTKNTLLRSGEDD